MPEVDGTNGWTMAFGAGSNQLLWEEDTGPKSPYDDPRRFRSAYWAPGMAAAPELAVARSMILLSSQIRGKPSWWNKVLTARALPWRVGHLTRGARRCRSRRSATPPS